MVLDNFKGNSFNGCFAVFDGHGGQRAAEFARTKLGTILEEHPALESNVHGSLNQGKSSESMQNKTAFLQSHLESVKAVSVGGAGPQMGA